MERSSDLSVEFGESEGNLCVHAVGDLAFQAQPILTRCLDTMSHQKVLAVRNNARVFSLTQPPLPSLLAARTLSLAAQLELSNRPIPTQATISLSSSCPCACWSSAPDRLHAVEGKDLSTEELKAVIDQALDLGVVSIHFCGGEPLHRQDLLELIHHVDPDRAMTLLYTNGLLLTSEMVKELARSPLHAVIVQLDSSTSKIHDTKRKMEGLFDQALAGLRRSVKADLLTGVATLVDQRLVGTGELERLVTLARQLGVAQVFAWHSLPGAFGPDGVGGNGSRLTAEGVTALNRLATDCNSDPNPPALHLADGATPWERPSNGGGLHHFLVTAKGEIFPWAAEDRSLGNLRDEDLGKIWSRANSRVECQRPSEHRTEDASRPGKGDRSTSCGSKQKARRIGLLAGSGHYPIYFSRGARRCGYEVVAVAIEEEADPELAQCVDEIHWVGVGLLQRIFDTFLAAGVTEVALTGKIHKTHLFSPVELDSPMIRVISSLERKDDVSLLTAISNEFERAGISVREPTAFLKNLQAAPGVLTRRAPTPSELADVQYGFGVAKSLADHGIGQTVVVKNGVVVAVEAIEGTDQTILRAGTLVPDSLVVVKVGCPNQDRRFDMPVVGMDTLKILVSAHAGVLAIDAANTVIVDKESLVEEADRHQIAIIAV